MSEAPTADDAHLVARASRGSRHERHAAFAELVVRHENYIRAMLYRLCGSKAEADELAQEAFLTAWLKLASLQSAASFRGWLRQLAYRQFLHAYRRRKVEWKHAEVVDPEPTVELAVSDDLLLLLALCSPLERELMVLIYGFEFTYAEIAASRQMAVGTVKSHVHRAKGKIKDFLEQDEVAKIEENMNG